jgi:hypothetical protein
MKRHIVLAGFGSENVLEGLALKLGQEDFSVTHINFISACDEEIKRLCAKEEDIIFITSQHISVDSISYKTFYPQAQHYLDPISIIALLNPIFTIYINHDVLDPFEDSDLAYSHYFDLFLIHTNHAMPTEISEKCLDLGDVKSLEKDLEFQLKNYLGKYGIFFLNSPNEFMNVLISEKHDEIDKLCHFLISNNIPIKIHNDESYSMIEVFLVKKKVKVLNRSYSAYHLIAASSFVVGNGEGSIFQEAKCQNKPLFWYDLNVGQNVEKEVEMKKQLSLREINSANFSSYTRTATPNTTTDHFFNFENFIEIIMKI